MDPDVIARIHELADQGYNASQIQRRLTRDGVASGDIPHVRTIRGHVRARLEQDRPPDVATDAPWFFADLAMSDADAALVMAVLAEREAELLALRRRRETERPGEPPVRPRPRYVVAREGAGYGPDREQARWIVRIRRAAPRLPALDTLRLARRFARAETAEGRGEVEAELMALMALMAEESSDDQA